MSVGRDPKKKATFKEKFMGTPLKNINREVPTYCPSVDKHYDQMSVRRGPLDVL